MGQNGDAVNRLEFFQQATLKILGNLDIAESLQQFLSYCSAVMPADRCCLQVYAPKRISDQWSIEIPLDLDRQEVKHRHVQAVIPWQFRKLFAMFESHGLLSFDADGIGFTRNLKDELEFGAFLEDERLTPELAEVLDSISGPGRVVRRIDSLHNHLETGYFARTLQLPDNPAVLLSLATGKTVVGALLITSYSGAPYTDHHIELLKLVRPVLSIALINYLRYQQMSALKDALADENRFLHEELGSSRDSTIIGADYGMKKTMDLVRHVSRQDSPVLLLGETGVGKEVIANAIHATSRRSKQSMIRVNCGAIPENLIDSELFGHEKGAFTGALARKKGRFERADGSTIFLDEVGELPLEAQVRLLRVLQEKEIERVGGTETIPVDIRIIAATNRDLKTMVVEGTFREDLFFRLNVFPIEIPPLRKRRIDIPPLTHHILARKARELNLSYQPTLDKGALDQLMQHTWPGNVRELENAIERALLIHEDKPLRFDELAGAPAVLSEPEEQPSTPTQPRSQDAILPYDTVVRQHLQRAIDHTEGMVHGPSGAAELLDIHPSTLRKRLRKYGISFGRDYQEND